MHTKEIILKAGIKLFLDQGYHGTSLKDIYLAAKVSPAMINYYFQSKENLLLTLLQRVEQPFSELIKRYNTLTPSFSNTQNFINDSLDLSWTFKEVFILCLKEYVQPGCAKSAALSCQIVKAHYRQFIRLANFNDDNVTQNKYLDLTYHSIFDMINGLFIARKLDCFRKTKIRQHSLQEIQSFIDAKIIHLK